MADLLVGFAERGLRLVRWPAAPSARANARTWISWRAVAARLEEHIQPFLRVLERGLRVSDAEPTLASDASMYGKTRDASEPTAAWIP
jgi:hypothetical protein